MQKYINTLEQLLKITSSQIYIFPKSSKGIGLFNILKKNKKKIIFIDNFLTGKDILNKKNSSLSKDAAIIVADQDKVSNLKVKCENIFLCNYDNFERIFSKKKLSNFDINIKAKFIEKNLFNLSSKKLFKLIKEAIIKKNNKKLNDFFIKTYKKPDTLNKMYLDYLTKIVTKVKNPTILDIGSSEGEFFLKTQKVFKKFRYFGFDPLLRKEKILKNINFKKIGISNFNGYGKILKNKVLNQSKIIKVQKKLSNVKITKVDTFCKLNKITKVDIIKVDVEGDEEKVLKGALEIIQKFKPFLFISCYHGPDQFFNVPWLLIKKLKGYKFYLQTYRCDAIETKIYCIPKKII